MYCSRCGFMLPENSVFCSKCGNQIGKNNTKSANGTKLIARKCLACDNNQLKKIGNNEYYCDYCGSTYVVDREDTIVESEITDQELIDAMEKATDLWIKDRYFEGLDVLKRYENHNPHNCRYWVKLGRAYGSCRYFQEAMNCYNKALEINDKDFAIYSNMAVDLMRERSDFEKARKLFEKAIAIVDSGVECKYGDYTFLMANYGLALIQTGEKDKGLKYIQRAETRGYENGDKLRKIAGLKKGIFGTWH